MALYVHLPLPFPWLPPIPHYHDESSCGLATEATRGALQNTESVSVGNVITLWMPAFESNHSQTRKLYKNVTLKYNQFPIFYYIITTATAVFPVPHVSEWYIKTSD
jgi:hypothetical protein